MRWSSHFLDGEIESSSSFGRGTTRLLSNARGTGRLLRGSSGWGRCSPADERQEDGSGSPQRSQGRTATRGGYALSPMSVRQEVRRQPT
jgi:hypothetical protein